MAEPDSPGRGHSGPGHPGLALISAVIAAASLVAGWSYGAALQAPGIDWSHESMTALAATTTAHRWAMTLAFVVTGAANVLTALTLPGVRRPGRALLGLSGLATAGLAIAPDPSLSQGWWVHTTLAGIALVSASAWPWWATGPRWATRTLTLTLLAIIATLPFTLGSPPFGVHERTVTTLLALVPIGYAARRWWIGGRAIGGPLSRTLISVVVLTAVCATGGIVATILAPASAHTRHYTATFSLSLHPGDAATLRATTLFGDIDVGFAGFAPGIRALPQVKASITEVLARPHITISSLEPGPLELDRAIRAGAEGLARRFAVGAVLVGLLAGVLGRALLRARARRHGRDRQLLRSATRRWYAACLAGVLAASTLTAGAFVLTYRSSRVEAFTSTGVLGTVQRNSGLLDDVEARSAQVAPYLRNLIALSGALQERYTPGALESPVALRLLLVSDLHDGNQYALMRSIIAEEQVDAVIDAGDLVDFGTVAEGEAAGMFSGIASLPVPYLFVRGNHDASFPGDQQVLDRLARIPNVVLLQPDPLQYTEVDLGGIMIRGFNDPRWFGDDGVRTAAKQQPAIAAYLATFQGRPEPDLLVSHEPAAVIGQQAGILVNGHMHTPDLEGNRIQVGTFTGGGPLTHYVPAEVGAELVGQPSAFDVLVFGQDCRLTSLTRYTFRDVLEGRPAYTSVSLLNGAQIDRRPVDPERTCTPGERLEQTPVPGFSP